MQLPVVTKITRPALGKILLREKLLQQLDDCNHLQMVWITGPGGSGKTTLVNSYIETRNFAYLWYRIDSSDNDPASFFHYLAQAVINTFPDDKNTLLPSFSSDLLFSIDWFSRQFFGAMTSLLKTPAILIFDNFQALSAESPVYSVLLKNLNLLPVGLRILIISRSEPPGDLARSSANGIMARISRKDLQLTREEFLKIAKMRGQTQEFFELLLPLYERLDGWAGGLSMLLDAARHGDFKPVLPASFAPSAIFDYFAAEIFAKMPEQLRSFSLKVSVLPDITAKMATALTGEAHSEKLLDDLLRDNHFIELRPSSSPVYLFHPLFKEFLVRRAVESFLRDELKQLQVRAASILMEEGRLEDSAAVLTQAEAWPELENLILSQAEGLVAKGGNISLLNWINSLPEERVQISGWLLYWKGICLCPLAPPESRIVLTRAYRIFRSQQNPLEMVLGWCAVELIHFIDCSDYSSLDALIDDVFSFLPRVLGQIPPELAATLGFHIFSALNMRQPHHPEMAAYSDQVDQLIDIIPDISQRLTIAARLMLHRCTQGELQKATRLVNILGPLSRDGSIAPFSKLNWCCAEVIHAVATADFEKCLEIVADAEKITSEAGVRTTEATILSMGAFSSLGKGDFKNADNYLLRMEKAILPGRFFEYALHHIQVALSFALRKKFGQALEMAKAALDLILKSGSPLIEPFIRFGIGQLCTDMGDYEDAAHELENAGRLGRAFNSPLAEFLSLVYGAQLQFKLGNKTGGLDMLTKGLKIGREKRFFWNIWDRHDVMADLCVRALQEDIETGYVIELIRKRGLVPDVPPIAVEKWPWPIRIYTLGKFEVLRHGKPMSQTGKSQQKPLLLLKIILASGGSKVGGERIADYLWPDADGDFQAQSLKTALHRLRKFLGDNNAIIFQDNQISLNPFLCWTDIWTFERLTGDADITENSSDDTQSLLERGLNLYLGPFLEQNGDEPWLILPREKYRNKYIYAIRQAARFYEDKAQWEAAINIYEKAMGAEPLIEEFYRKMMSCYKK